MFSFIFIVANICTSEIEKTYSKLKSGTLDLGFFYVFSCEYCEIFRNIDFEEHLRTAASEPHLKLYNVYFVNFEHVYFNIRHVNLTYFGAFISIFEHVFTYWCAPSSQ